MDKPNEFKKLAKGLEELQKKQEEAGFTTPFHVEAKQDCSLFDHQCEICMKHGCGINSMNLICDECQKELPSLLKSVGDLHPLRELFQCYQDAKESIEATGSTEWWLNKFVKVTGKLLE